MLHIRHVFPLPNGLSALLKRFKNVLVIEQNTGHLAALIRAKTLVNVEQYNVVDGLPISSEKLSSFLIKYLKVEVTDHVSYA
jgi:2-oxoglutarate ferredoxin oxidoreductase subunit alpha